MAEESDKLKEYTQKLDKVMKYTGGNINRARQVIEGTLKDFLVLKGKLIFESKEESGLFLVFLHRYKQYMVNKFSIIKDSMVLANTVNVTDSWKAYFAEINSNLEANTYIEEKVSKINIQFEKEFTLAIISQMIGKLDNRDLTSVTVQLENILNYALDDNDFFLQIDCEEMTSLDYEEIVKSAVYKQEQKKAEEQAQKETEKAYSEKEEDEISQERNSLSVEGNVIVNGELNLSPIKGKFISEVMPGDVVTARIKDASRKAINVIKQLNLFTPEGKIKKTRGKVLFVKKSEKGFTLFIQIAPMVILEVTEEEEVKVEYFPPYAVPQKKKKSSGNLPIIIISSMITVIIVLILIVFVAF